MVVFLLIADRYNKWPKDVIILICSVFGSMVITLAVGCVVIHILRNRHRNYKPCRPMRDVELGLNQLSEQRSVQYY